MARRFPAATISGRQNEPAGVPGAMTLLVRCDATVAMGTGHAMRCLALAQAWQDLGGVAVFVMTESTPAIESRLREQAVEVIKLQTEPGSGNDARETAQLATRRNAKWV